MLTVENLSRRFGDAAALESVDCSVERGTLAVLVGRSGAGKTTLLRCIDGLTDPTAGTVALDGEPIARRDAVALVFQSGALLGGKSALENVLDGGLGRGPAWRELLGWHAPNEKRAALAQLHGVGLAGMADRPVRALSGGERQRVGVARALHQEPDVLLADEPVASLDPETGRRVLGVIADAVRERDLVGIVSLHQPGLAAGIADRYLGLRGGRLVLDAADADEAALEGLYEGGEDGQARTGSEASSGSEIRPGATRPDGGDDDD